MYIGIDLGTSGVKAILLNEQGDVLATHTEKLTVSRPHPLWSEQEPEQWWQATDRAVKGLGRQQSLSGVRALGIAGQMHGATLLDSRQQVLRPAILWNDGRCSEECAWLEKQVPQSRAITGNLMMPGFTAPKLVWVQRHEPDIFYQIDKVLLPKDFLRLRMTGVFASDMSDAAGTMWLDVKKRVGIGMIDAGQAMLSLGTSGVYFAVSDGFLSKPESAVHSFCHALPERWHLMSGVLSAASCLDWAAKLTGQAHVICFGGRYGCGSRLRRQTRQRDAYRRRGAQRILASDAI